MELVPGQPTPRLYDHVVEVLRARHYSRRTKGRAGTPAGTPACHAARSATIIHWIRRFLLFHDRAHPSTLAEDDVNRFLPHLAVQGNVAASTGNQALAAVLFLYPHVLQRPLNRVEGVVRARRPKRLPVVLTREEVDAVLAHRDGMPGLVCMVGIVLYGCGLRLLEALQLRAKDLDFGRGEIPVRDGKGQKDRVTMLPDVLRQPLQEHLRCVRERHQADLKKGPTQALRRFCDARYFCQPHHGARSVEVLRNDALR